MNAEYTVNCDAIERRVVAVDDDSIIIIHKSSVSIVDDDLKLVSREFIAENAENECHAVQFYSGLFECVTEYFASYNSP